MTTTWTSAHGPQMHTSTRHAGEADEQWRLRHFSEVAAKMKVEPPI